MSEQPTTTESTPIENYQSKIYEQELLIKDYETHIHEQELQIEQFTNETQELKKTIRKLQSQLTSTIHESNSMEELTDPTLESVSGYEPTNEIMERQMEELRTEIERQNREIDDLKHTNDDLIRENEEKCSLIRQESEELKEKLMSAIREKDKTLITTQDEKSKLEDLYKKTCNKLSIIQSQYSILEEKNTDMSEKFKEIDKDHEKEQKSMLSVIYNLGNKVMDKYYYSGLTNYKGESWLDQARISQKTF